MRQWLSVLCVQTHQEALTIFEARQDQPGMAETLDLLGMAHALHGDHVSAVDYLGRAIELFRSQGNTPSLASALASRAIIGPADVETLFSTLGTPDECLRDATEALALAYLLRRERAKAQAVLEAAMPADAHPRNLAERRMLWAWGEVALAVGDDQGALRIAGHLLASAPGTSRAQPIPWLLKLKGEALAALLHLDEAAQTLEAAKDGARQRQERPLLWQIHRSLGRVYQRLKDEERAERAFAEARIVIAELAASITDPIPRELFSQEALKSLPREKPIPERRAAAERFGGLTERELEVLRLLAMGLTSAQIAERLTISLLTIRRAPGERWLYARDPAWRSPGEREKAEIAVGRISASQNRCHVDFYVATTRVCELSWHGRLAMKKRSLMSTQRAFCMGFVERYACSTSGAFSVFAC